MSRFTRAMFWITVGALVVADDPASRNVAEIIFAFSCVALAADGVLTVVRVRAKRRRHRQQGGGWCPTTYPRR